MGLPAQSNLTSSFPLMISGHKIINKTTSTIYILTIFFSLTITCQSQANGKFVEAKGIAPITNDIGLTRDVAILRAKQAAIERLGVGLRSETIVDMGLLLDDIVKTQTFGLVKSFNVISEFIEGNQYKVRIRAWVVSREEENEIMENLFSDRSFSVRSCGEGSRSIEKELLNQLSENNYLVLDPGFSKWKPNYNIIAKSAVALSQNMGDIESYYCDIEIRLINRSEGTLALLEVGPDDNRIYGLNRIQALRSKGTNGFYRKIAEPTVKKFMRKLKKKELVKEHKVEIVVRNIPNYEFFRDEFCRMLRAFRLGVKDIFNKRYDKGSGSVTVLYTEKVDYLAAMIGFRNQYIIKSVDRGKIQLIFQGELSRH